MARTVKFACPCCGRKRIEKLGDYEICDVCGWEDDPTQSKDPDFALTVCWTPLRFCTPTSSCWAYNVAHGVAISKLMAMKANHLFKCFIFICSLYEILKLFV